MGKLRGKPVTKNGQVVKTNLDPTSLSRVSWGKEYLEKELGVPANNSTVVRRAIEVYVDHLENLGADLFPMEKLYCYEANEGRSHTIETPIQPNERRELPLFSDLIPPKWPREDSGGQADKEMS